MKLSLVIPCYNEEQSVACFFAAAQQTFRDTGYAYEYVFVDDGSRDGTLAELKKLCRTQQAPVKVLSFSRNFGKEAAILAGLRHASGDYVSVIDADLQQHPDIVRTMVSMLDADSDLDCIAAVQAQRHESAVLSGFKKAFYRIINRMSSTEFVSGASDFRTMRRQMVNEVVSLSEYHRFSKGIFSWVGFHTKYIPYEVRERAAGESKWNFRKLFRYALDGIESYSVSPLKLPLWLGVFNTGLAAVYLLLHLILWLCGICLPLAALLVGVIVFFAGLNLTCLGIFGEYLAKAYIQGKNRPIYILRESLSNEEHEN